MTFFQRIIDGQFQFINHERFNDVIRGAELHRLDSGLGRCKCRDHDNDGFRRDFLDRFEHRNAVYTGHFYVADNQIEYFRLDGFQGVGAVLSRNDIVAFLLQQDREEIPHALFVIDNEYLAHFGFRLSERARPWTPAPGLRAHPRTGVA